MKEKISNFQAIVLLYSTIIPTALISVPHTVIHAAHQDAWLSMLLAMTFSCSAAVIIGRLVKANPGLPFLEWVEQRLGRPVGLGIGLLLLLYYLALSCTILREFSNFLKEQILLNTPVFVIMAVILLVSGYAVLKGIETIARINIIVTAIALAAYVFSFIIMAKMIKLSNLQPHFQTDIRSLLYGTLLPVSWMSEAAVLLLLAPYVKDRARSVRISVWGILLPGTHLLLTIILIITIFGSQLPATYRYSSLNLVEIIRIGNFLERIDIFFISFWILTIFIKLFIFVFGAFHCMNHTFKLKPMSPMMAVLLLLMLLISLRSNTDISAFTKYLRLVSVPELLFMNVILPLGLTAAVFLVKGRRN